MNGAGGGLSRGREGRCGGEAAGGLAGRPAHLARRVQEAHRMGSPGVGRLICLGAVEMGGVGALWQLLSSVLSPHLLGTILTSQNNPLTDPPQSSAHPQRVTALEHQLKEEQEHMGKMSITRTKISAVLDARWAAFQRNL